MTANNDYDVCQIIQIVLVYSKHEQDKLGTFNDK